MYNGQFVKALAHVLIFAVFVSLSDKSFVFGLLIAAWVFYQVFDAAQTAKARRDGLPLPNPFGLNDLGNKLGIAPPASPYAAGFTPPPGTPASGATAPGSNPGVNPGVNPNPYSGSGFGQTPNPSDPFHQPPVYTSSYAVPPPGTAGAPGMPPYSDPLAIEPRHRHPFGAVVLIVIGLLLLLHTLGIFEDEWIGRAWPLILIGIGAWLLYRRTREVPPGGAR
jgi:hypothetical protein